MVTKICVRPVRKNCLLLIRSEKLYVKLGVEKKFDHEEKPLPPYVHVSNGPPLTRTGPYLWLFANFL